MLSAIADAFPRREPKRWVHFLALLALEGLGRVLGYYDYYVARRSHVIWEVAESTKELRPR